MKAIIQLRDDIRNGKEYQLLCLQNEAKKLGLEVVTEDKMSGETDVQEKWKGYKGALDELRKEKDAFNETAKHFEIDITEADVGFSIKTGAESYVNEVDLLTAYEELATIRKIFESYGVMPCQK